RCRSGNTGPSRHNPSADRRGHLPDRSARAGGGAVHRRGLGLRGLDAADSDAHRGRHSRLPDEVLVSYDGENIYSGQTNAKRPGIARIYGDKALASGFRFLLPFDLFKDKKIDNSKIRLFAVSNGIACELNYFRGFK
ncbi:hypothetical protein IH970_01025, partial [candidate division KSB1 bacterium]|nr:hypothetical protein [candidate division KSB1 bacterium]